MAKLYSIGECLVDFIPQEKGKSLSQITGFQRQAGGAPANVAVACAKLGGESYFVGKLSYDAFGDYLFDTLKQNKVRTDYIYRTGEAKTALAFVSLKADGERDFSFYRDPSADMLLNDSEVQDISFADDDIVHFCSVSLIDAPIKKAHYALLNKAVEAGALISFDVNIRLPIFPSEAECKSAVEEFLHFAELLKLSEDELYFLTDIAEEKSAVKYLFEKCPRANYIILTKGAQGAMLFDRSLNFISESAVKVEAVDSTGAGDCFIGCVLTKLLRGGRMSNIKGFYDILRFACSGAAVCVSKKGAINAMPTQAEINKYF